MFWEYWTTWATPIAIGLGAAVAMSVAAAKACIWAGKTTSKLDHVDECLHRIQAESRERLDRIDSRLDSIDHFLRDGPENKGTK